MTNVVVDEPLALAMAIQGASFRQIARAAGGCHGTVRNRLLKHGYRRASRFKRNQVPSTTVTERGVVLSLPCGRTCLIDAATVALLGCWTWTARVGGDGGKPYVGRQVSGQTIKLHRLIMSAKPGQIVDHINGDTLDNRRQNLRFATPAGNSQNRGPGKNNRSGFKGVSRFRARWQASISSGRKSYNLGHYDTAADAALAYDRAARRMFGEYAWLNFPDDRLWDRDHDPRSDNRSAGHERHRRDHRRRPRDLRR